MLRTLLDIAMNWTVRGEDPPHVRCRRCGAIHSEGAGGGHFLTTASFTVQQTAEGQAVSDSLTTPAEWVCPCGRRSPLEIGELLTNDTPVSCRRRWICRNRWRVPGEVTQMTCPCCWTDQAGPAA